MSPIRMTQIESSVRTVMEFNDAFNLHDVAAMMRLTTDDTVFENTSPSPDGTLFSGKPAVTKFWEDFFRDAPNAHIEIEEIFGMGNRCVMRWTYTWGDGHVRGVDVFKLKDGLIAEKLSYVKG
ncbi:MAG: nuclear transport factor 2 family protein [Anaerolineales bacterium]|nr:nuclear transport factor 2 family protein [Anaerolineales bacterium]